MGLTKTRSSFLLGQTLTLNLAGPLVKLTKGLEKSSLRITEALWRAVGPLRPHLCCWCRSEHLDLEALCGALVLPPSLSVPVVSARFIQDCPSQRKAFLIKEGHTGSQWASPNHG